MKYQIFVHGDLIAELDSFARVLGSIVLMMPSTRRFVTVQSDEADIKYHGLVEDEQAAVDEALAGKLPQCTRAYHDTLRADAELFSTLRMVGVQHWNDGYPSEQLANCRCGSTLHRVIEKEAAHVAA